MVIFVLWLFNTFAYFECCDFRILRLVEYDDGEYNDQENQNDHEYYP